MFKKILWVLVGLIIAIPIIAGLAGTKLNQFSGMKKAMAGMVAPPTAVNVAQVVEKEWQPRISVTGNVMAMQGTLVSTEADGIVREIKFEAGSDVKAGDLLVQLDTDIELSNLRDSEAAAELAKVSFSRAKELLDSRNISQAEYDTAAATLKQAMAKVDNFRAIIRRKAVIAPFAGKLGIRQISVGQYLTKGSPVVSLQSVDPIYVQFSLPQQTLGDLKEGLQVLAYSDAYPDAPFEGKITAINPDIDLSTRNVQVQATFPNGEGKLRPGMFVTVDLILDKKENVLFIPQTAIQHAPYGDSVFVVQDANSSATVVSDLPTTPSATADSAETTVTLVVKQQLVRLGSRLGDYVIAREGVKLGETLVSTGVFKLSPGTTVTLDNTLAPKFSFEPKPSNT